MADSLYTVTAGISSETFAVYFSKSKQYIAL